MTNADGDIIGPISGRACMFSPTIETIPFMLLNHVFVFGFPVPSSLARLYAMKVKAHGHFIPPSSEIDVVDAAQNVTSILIVIREARNYHRDGYDVEKVRELRGILQQAEGKLGITLRWVHDALTSLESSASDQEGPAADIVRLENEVASARATAVDLYARYHAAQDAANQVLGEYNSARGSLLELERSLALKLREVNRAE